MMMVSSGSFEPFNLTPMTVSQAFHWSSFKSVVLPLDMAVRQPQTTNQNQKPRKKKVLYEPAKVGALLRTTHRKNN
jgi:hypothetical protein